MTKKKIDLYTKILLKYQNEVTPIAKVGLDVKSEGEFLTMINQNKQETYRLRISEIKRINEIINKFLRKNFKDKE